MSSAGNFKVLHVLGMETGAAIHVSGAVSVTGHQYLHVVHYDIWNTMMILQDYILWFVHGANLMF